MTSYYQKLQVCIITTATTVHCCHPLPLPIYQSTNQRRHYDHFQPLPLCRCRCNSIRTEHAGDAMRDEDGDAQGDHRHDAGQVAQGKAVDDARRGRLLLRLRDLAHGRVAVRRVVPYQ